MPGSIQSIERAAAMLELIAAGPRPLRLAEISVALRLPKGTAHGILRTLIEVGFVDQDRVSGRFQLGDGLANLGSGALDHNEMRARSMNWADPLAARTGEAVRVAMLLISDVLVVHSVFRPDDTRQRSDVGMHLPGHATALGKTLLAYNPAALSRLPDPMICYTSRTIGDPSGLGEELERVRRHGYALELSEHVPDQASIAAPVHGFGGMVVASVAIHGHPDRLCEGTGTPRPKLLAHLLDCARSISRDLETARSTRS